jgi:ABC-type Mn2+/Zn2+ transport system permease subunit
MSNASDLYAWILTLLFAVAAGLVGSFALMKRMLLAADVISHVALPGLGVAFLLGFNPLLGGGATLFAGTLLIWQLQKKTGLEADATIGVVFAGSVAVGAVLTPQEDLVEALFGRFESLTLPTFLAGALAVVLIIAVILRFKDQLVLSLFAPDLAAAEGVRLNRLNLYYLLIFSLTVLVGLRFMGALLAGALVIIPAATGRRLARNVTSFLFVSCLVSAVAVAAGLLITRLALPRFSLGPITAIVAAVFFAASLLVRTEHPSSAA